MADLIVEDGTGLATANAYISVADAAAFNVARGNAMPADPVTAAAQIIRATDYLENLADRWLGVPEFDGVQALAWPRILYQDCGIYVNYSSINCVQLLGVSPRIIKASAILAFAAGTVNFFPITTGPEVTEKTIGPIKTSYSERNGALGGPFLRQIDSLLRPLFTSAPMLLSAQRG